MWANLLNANLYHHSIASASDNPNNTANENVSVRSGDTLPVGDYRRLGPALGRSGRLDIKTSNSENCYVKQVCRIE